MAVHITDMAERTKLYCVDAQKVARDEVPWHICHSTVFEPIRKERVTRWTRPGAHEFHNVIAE